MAIMLIDCTKDIMADTDWRACIFEGFLAVLALKSSFVHEQCLRIADELINRSQVVFSQSTLERLFTEGARDDKV